jgi:protease-4
MFFKTHQYLLIALIVAAAWLPIHLKAQQTASQQLTEGATLTYPSVTTQSNIASLETNPAGLGFVEGGSLRGVFDLAKEESDSSEYAAFLGGGTGYVGGGLGVQFLNRPVRNSSHSPYRKYTFGVGFSSASNISFGTTYNFYGSGDFRPLDDLSSWDVGLQWRPTSYLGFGGVAKNLNQPFLTDNRTVPVELTGGTSLRFADGHVLIEVEADKRVGQPSMGWIPRVWFEPVNGLSIFGQARLENQNGSAPQNTTLATLSGGLSLQLQNFVAQSAAQFRGDDPEFTGQSVEIGVDATPARDSLVTPSEQWIKIPVSASIRERPRAGLFEATGPLFVNLLDRLDSATENEQVGGIVLELKSPNLGYAQIWELRQVISQLREAGKAVHVFTENTSYSDIYLASAGHKLWTYPGEPYSPSGVHTRLTSYQKLLNKIGIEAEFVRIGAFKSAPESFTESEPSKENISQTESYLDFLFDRVNRAIADSRDLETSVVEKTLNQIPLYPTEALDEGFVDKYLYASEIEDELETQYNVSSLREVSPTSSPARQTWGAERKVGIVPITGMIVEGRSSQFPLFGDSVTGHKTIEKTLERLTKTPSVRAIVIRIDSPGGSAKASDLIYRAIRRAAAEKPVIASMGNVAASGGYYVAAAADKIYATPMTLTGSIGIFAGKFSLESLVDDIGIADTELQRGTRADLFDPYEPWTEDEKQSIKKSMRYLYNLFLTQIAQNRALNTEEVDAVGRGRIWNGREAKQKGLVDHLGGLKAAIENAEKEAGLQVDTLSHEVYPAPGGLLPGTRASSASRLVGALDNRKHASFRNALESAIEQLGPGAKLPFLFSDTEPLAMMPARLSTHE